MSDNSTFVIASVVFLVMGLNVISDIIYFPVFTFSIGIPLKYQLSAGIGVPVALNVKKAVSPSMRVLFIASGVITGAPF